MGNAELGTQTPFQMDDARSSAKPGICENSTMKRLFAATVWPEGIWRVSQCLEVDVASQGETEEEALANLKEGGGLSRRRFARSSADLSLSASAKFGQAFSLAPGGLSPVVQGRYAETQQVLGT